MSLKAKLLKRPGHEYFVEDWQETVYVRSMSERELREYQKLTQEENLDHHAIMRGVVAGHMLDEKGARIFCDDEMEEVQDLSFSGIQSVFNAILKRTIPSFDLEKEVGN